MKPRILTGNRVISPAYFSRTTNFRLRYPSAKRFWRFWKPENGFSIVIRSSSRSEYSNNTERDARNEPFDLAQHKADFSSSLPENYPLLEVLIEKVIYRCRFLTLFGVFGSLCGSLLCFIKGSTYVASSFKEFIGRSGKVILLLVEAIDVYLLGTVMLIFGMGLYELFVSNLEVSRASSAANCSSSLFGLFKLKERPKWLEIESINELKTKVGHVIVMILLIGLFEKSKKVAITSPLDLLYFCTSILLSSSCLLLLSKLNSV